MNAARMRLEIARVYPSPSFKTRLMKMPDNQIVAVFRRLQSEGKIK